MTQQDQTEQDLAAQLEAAPLADAENQNQSLPADGAAEDPNAWRADLDDDQPTPDQEPPKRMSGDRPEGELYDNCPVVPLGVRGDFIYILDVLGQLRCVKKCEAQTIQSLFGHQIPELCYKFPQWTRDEDSGSMVRKRGKFDQGAASMALYAAASECGVFNPENAVRGVGAWTDDDGKLIYHAGDKIWCEGEWKRPGRMGGRIYPAFPPIPRPLDATTTTDPVPEILKTLETWNWTSPETHPFLTLGMIGAQMLSGALDWRPVFWLLAPAGAGKSELQKMLKLMHGDAGLVQTTDATKSGITSKLGQSSLPVAVDELEPGDERSSKEKDIITLARVAASGGEWFRGTSDQTGVGGKVYSTFLFSSILIPGVMKTQDVQRLIRLELKPLPKGIAKLHLEPRTWRRRGAALKALLFDRWDTFPERIGIWRHALEKHDVTGRDADNWQTVLAIADMALSEDIMDETSMSGWCEKIAFLVNADREETHNDADAMLLHLMGQPFDPYRRGEQFNVAQWIMAAAGLTGAPAGVPKGVDDQTIDPDVRRRECNAILAKYGLRVQGTGEEAKLFIANQAIHGLNELFRNSQWHGGVWKQSASRVPGAQPTPNPLTLAGIRSRGYELPVRHIPGLTSFPMDKARKSVVDAVSGSSAADDEANWTV